jgi:hypothetical protein
MPSYSTSKSSADESSSSSVLGDHTGLKSIMNTLPPFFQSNDMSTFTSMILPLFDASWTSCSSKIWDDLKENASNQPSGESAAVLQTVEQHVGKTWGDLALAIGAANSDDDSCILKPRLDETSGMDVETILNPLFVATCRICQRTVAQAAFIAHVRTCNALPQGSTSDGKSAAKPPLKRRKRQLGLRFSF